MASEILRRDDGRCNLWCGKGVHETGLFPGAAGSASLSDHDRENQHSFNTAYVNYDLEQITEAVVNNGGHAYVDPSDNAESRFLLPEVYHVENGAIVFTFGYTKGRLSLQIKSESAGALLGTVRLYEGRYKLNLLIGSGES